MRDFPLNYPHCAKLLADKDSRRGVASRPAPIFMWDKKRANKYFSNLTDLYREFTAFSWRRGWDSNPRGELLARQDAFEAPPL